MALEDISILETPIKNFEQNPGRITQDLKPQQLIFNQPSPIKEKSPSIKDLNLNPAPVHIAQQVQSTSPSKINPFHMVRKDQEQPISSVKCSPAKPTEDKQLFLTPQKVFATPRAQVPALGELKFDRVDSFKKIPAEVLKLVEAEKKIEIQSQLTAHVEKQVSQADTTSGLKPN
jgi:hypothetical protein